MSATTIAPLVISSAAPKTQPGLWLSYQRYVILLVVGPLALVSFSLFWMPEHTWLWVGLSLVAFPCWVGSYAMTGRLSHKFEFTAAAQVQMSQGNFDAHSVQQWCTAPCDRVVANTVLKMAGHTRAQRWALIRELNQKERECGGILMFVNHNDGVVYTYENGQMRADNIQGSENSNASEGGDNGNSTGR